MRAAAVVVLLALGAPAPAVACSVCGCGDPTVLASEARPAAGWLRLALDLEVLTARARSDDHPALTESLLQLTVRPVVVVSPTLALSLVLQLPFVLKDWSLGDGARTLARSRRFNLGDLDLGVRWFLVDSTSFARQRRQSLALSASSNFPTGPADAEDAEGERIDEHAQLGTGAFSPAAGLLYALHQDPWNLFLAASYRAHTRNRFGYRYGDAVLWTARLELRPLERLAIGLGLDGRYAWRDDASGEPQQNTGGLAVALTPGAIVNLAGPFWLYARLQAPVLTKLLGEQRLGPTAFLSVQYSLSP